MLRNVHRFISSWLWGTLAVNRRTTQPSGKTIKSLCYNSLPHIGGQSRWAQPFSDKHAVFICIIRAQTAGKSAISYDVPFVQRHILRESPSLIYAVLWYPFPTGSTSNWMTGISSSLGRTPWKSTTLKLVKSLRI